jgi:hypothetical protein
MDNSLQELEHELKALKPRSASSRWIEQINRELAAELPATTKPVYATATNLASWKWWGWRVAAAAVVVAAMTVGVVQFRRADSVTTPTELAQPPRVAAESPQIYHPVAAANVLYELKDEGAVAGDESARQIRARYVDTYTWKNPRTNASIKWTVPRDEIRVVPASYRQN